MIPVIEKAHRYTNLDSNIIKMEVWKYKNWLYCYFVLFP